MNEQYFNEIRQYLKILESSKVESEIELLKKQDKLELSAKEQANLILKKYSINPKAVINNKNMFKERFKEFLKAVNNFIDIMTKNDLQGNIKILFDLFIFIALICLLKIPFILVRYVGESLLQYLENPAFYNVWDFTIELVYLFVAVVVIINVFPKWFKNIKPTKKVEPKKEEVAPQPVKESLGKDLQSISLNENENENK